MQVCKEETEQKRKRKGGYTSKINEMDVCLAFQLYVKLVGPCLMCLMGETSLISVALFMIVALFFGKLSGQPLSFNKGSYEIMLSKRTSGFTVNIKIVLSNHSL